jgi:hypothetical protein
MRMQGPSEVTAVSIDGEQIPVINGIIDVAAKHVEMMKSHGFFLIRDEPAPQRRAVPPVMPSSTRKGR